MADDNLLCSEDIVQADAGEEEAEAAEPPSGGDEDLFAGVSSKYTDGPGGDEEFVRFLVEKETAHEYKVGQSVDFDEWVSGVRTEAVDWFLKTRASLGFRWKTAHLSVTHLDRFMSKFVFEAHRRWVAKLLPVACFSLAAKMEETLSGYLSLPAYPVQGWSFEYEAIGRMEFQVLTKLAFKLNTPSPFDYIPCFILQTVESCPPAETVSRITKLVFALTRVVNLRNHRPSSVAIAAILAALDRTMGEEALTGRLNSFAYAHLVDIGNAAECYNLMRNLDVEDGAEEPGTSPDISPGRFDVPSEEDYCGSVKSEEDYCGSVKSEEDYCGSVKRRRLDFDKPPDHSPDLE